MQISTSQLQFAYPGEKPLQFPDLQLASGQHILLLGPSGSGKSTLLHLLALLHENSAGQLQIGDQSIEKLKGGERERFRNAHIGLVWQKAWFVQALSMRDNLKLARKKDGEALSIDELCQSLGVAHLLGKKPAELSIGELQRMNIIRAVLNRPALLLADEPTSALDEANAHKVIDLLKSLAVQSGASLIIATHDHRIRDKFDQIVQL